MGKGSLGKSNLNKDADTYVDLPHEARQIILKLLKEHIPTSEVWVYGSRVTGTAKHNSDLDMVVFTNSEQSQDVIDLIDAFEESDLLFQVEVFVWDKTPDSFKANIKRKHVVLQKAC